MSTDDSQEKWLTSDETRKNLHVSACKLAHLRTDGKLRYRKDGNAYLYSPDDIEQIAKKKRRDP